MPLTVIHASAGSGKTYQLAVAFLRLLLKAESNGEPLDPATILATTFMRAAAGEILDRVIQLLANAVLSDKDRAMLAENIGAPLSLSICGRVLGRLAAHLDRLTVSTMDAFFGQIAKAFAAELGLAPGWEMAVDETEAEIQRATLHFLLAQTGESDLVEALAAFRRQQVGSSVQGTLDRLTAAFQKLSPAGSALDAFRLPTPRFWATEETAAALRLLNEPEPWAPKTKAGAIPKTWVKALDQLAERLQPGQKAARLFETTLVRRMFAGEGFDRQEIPDVLVHAVAPHLAVAQAEIQRLHRARMEALTWLARHYQSARLATLFDQAAYTFGDITHYVGRQSLRNDDLYYRLGTKFQHVLFDEFQDTSREQYEFFRPLLEEIGSNGGSSIVVVGDEKQAIYGWRGGERELMHGPLRELGAKIGEESAPTLNRSYRSSPAVLNALNRTFGALRGAWGSDNPVLEAAGREWVEGFVDHVPAPRVANLQGEVRLFEATKGDDEDKNAPLIAQVVDLVSEHQQHGRSVAVLLRKNKLLSRLMAGIRHACPDADVSGEGGNPLTDSRAVELLLSLFTWLDHPGHTAARFHVLTNPARAAFGFADSVQATAAPGPEEWHTLREIRRTLMDRGLAEGVRTWIRQEIFLASCNAYDRLRCEQLLEVAREYSQRAPARFSQFVAHIRNRRVERRGGSSVRLMSIHASKGLEFEAVVLMDIDARMGSGGEPEIAEHEGAWQVVPNKEESVPLGLEELLEAEARRDFAEELCVLYVGMTRARSFLDIVLREESKAPLAQLLRTGWKPDAERVVERFPGITVRACDEANGRSASRELADPGIAQAPYGILSQTETARPYHRAAYATPSSQEEAGTVSVPSLLAPANRAAMKRGELVHAWLSKVTWLEDGLPAPADLLSATGPLWEHLPRKEAETLASRLLQQIATPGTPLHQVFSKHLFAPEARVELWRERRFAVMTAPAQNTELLTGSFDRVVLWCDPAHCIQQAHIVDFKTDRFDSEPEREQLEARYQPQLNAYQRALSSAIPGLMPSLIQTSLCFLKLSESL